jgi:diaminopimelate epimerase
MHGLGNDFVMIDARQRSVPRLREKAEAICDRHMGIGCDQIIVIAKSRKADYRMQIFNADGSEVEMCGNGIRCFAKYLWDRKDKIIRRKKYLDVETPAGIIRPRMISSEEVEVDMGSPILDGSAVPTTFKGEVVDKPLKIGGKTYNITAVSMGNPHCIIFTDDADGVDLENIGPVIENHKAFPNRTNVEFVQPISRSRIKVRVWERGSGITLACGTGACASAVASTLNKKTGRKARVDLPGGALKIEWSKNDRVLMTGPAVEVYSGEINL